MTRGVLTFVASSFSSSDVASERLPDCQCLAVRIADVLVFNSYAPPGDERQRLQAEHVHKLFHHCQWRGKWVVPGDFNQSWTDSWISIFFANLEHGARLKGKLSRVLGGTVPE